MRINKIISQGNTTPLRDVPNEEEEKKLRALHCVSCTYAQKDSRPGTYCELFKRRIEPQTNKCLEHTMVFNA